jgi:single-strand selective monofunctional uracil DNA glycosylase
MRVAGRMSRQLGALRFGAPVTHVYDPLSYAREGFRAFVQRYARRGVKAVWLGMNPGPFGMAQTGVPFGDVVAVRDWMGIEARVRKPEPEHPRRPVFGFDCPRREGSGKRLWGWAAERFGAPEQFFERFFVVNYCPLCFLEESGRNRTPDHLARNEREALGEICDAALKSAVEILRPGMIVGVGKYAEARARAVLPDLRVESILHPSPANPQANKNWVGVVEEQLAGYGLL